MCVCGGAADEAGLPLLDELVGSLVRFLDTELIHVGLKDREAASEELRYKHSLRTSAPPRRDSCSDHQ